MLIKVEIRPIVGSPLALNTEDGSGSPLYPLANFDIETAIDNPSYKKMAAAGEWESFGYPDAMTVSGDGQILGVGASDAARAANYVSQRLALVEALLPPMTLMTSRIHAVLRVRMDGMSEDADARVRITQQSLPLAAMQGARGAFRFTMKSFVPVFLGTSSGNPYLLG
jgi:hypothetical protein